MFYWFFWYNGTQARQHLSSHQHFFLWNLQKKKWRLYSKSINFVKTTLTAHNLWKYIYSIKYVCTGVGFATKQSGWVGICNKITYRVKYQPSSDLRVVFPFFFKERWTLVDPVTTEGLTIVLRTHSLVPTDYSYMARKFKTP